jgi:hypothetical protein
MFAMGSTPPMEKIRKAPPGGFPEALLKSLFQPFEMIIKVGCTIQWLQAFKV